MTRSRAHTDRPFGVNVFVPSPEPADPAGLQAYLRRIESEAARHGADVGEPRFEDDHFDSKLELVHESRPAVVSFTFGCPAQPVFERLHEHDIAAWVTVTERRRSRHGAPPPARTRWSSREPRPAATAARSSTTRTPRGIGLLALLQLVRRAS